MSAEQIAGQARQFASREYLHALYKGDRMTPEERTKVIADLARLTGLSKVVHHQQRSARHAGSLQRRTDARSASRAFALRCARRRLLADCPAAGAAAVGAVAASAAPQPAVDFNMSTISGPFAAAYGDYLRRELTFTGQQRWNLLSDQRRRRHVHIHRERRCQPLRGVRPQSESAPLRQHQLLRPGPAVLCGRIYAGASGCVARSTRA